MMYVDRRLLVIAMLIASAWPRVTHAHDTPVQLPPPQSVGEAWNVIEQSKANVDQLIDANLMRDVGAQLANLSIALRTLATLTAANDPHAEKIHQLVTALTKSEVELLKDTRDPNIAKEITRLDWDAWGETFGQLEALYPADVVKAEVYICPMHPDDRHLNANDKCAVCGMSLIRRHLPASGVYQKAGQGTLKMTASCAPLVVGQAAKVVVHLSKADGSPVKLDDLIEMHTKKIHLLINDHSLNDYHHEHPEPTQTPGDYAFTFTPQKPGPYRIWADVVPAATSVQEYVIADLSADTQPLPIADRQTRLSTTVDGRRFDLTFDASAGPVRAQQTIVGTVNITGSDGQPFTQLEPVMGAFAHIVGFSEDGKSVLHIHPYGREPTGSGDRAGPVFAFKFYAPAAGFLRLYAQVQIDGKNVFAPFNLNVLPAPATEPTTQPSPALVPSPGTPGEG